MPYRKRRQKDDATFILRVFRHEKWKKKKKKRNTKILSYNSLNRRPKQTSKRNLSSLLLALTLPQGDSEFTGAESLHSPTHIGLPTRGLQDSRYITFWYILAELSSSLFMWDGCCHLKWRYCAKSQVKWIDLNHLKNNRPSKGLQRPRMSCSLAS